MTIEQIQSKIEGRREANKARKEAIERDVLMHHVAMSERLDSVACMMPKVVDALAELGLEVAEFTATQAGYANSSWPVWKEDDFLSVQITARPLPGSSKFRFLMFRGYTARGDGKNREQLREKAQKIVNHIQERTRLTTVGVNECSLEIREADETKSVLMSYTI